MPEKEVFAAPSIAVGPVELFLTHVNRASNPDTSDR